MTDQWIPVSERLPKYETYVLAFWSGNVDSWAVLYRTTRGWFDDDHDESFPPTHWQPLPEPPKGEV